jgi:hypothetical protein
MSSAPKRGPYQQKFPEKWSAILLFLMNKGPANKFKIWESLLADKIWDSPKTGYSTVHKAVDRLEEMGMLYTVGERKARTGLTVKTYKLTVPGLTFAMLSWKDKSSWTDICKHYRDLLPKVFEKWRHFVAEGAEELAKKSLLGAFDIFWRDYDWESEYRDADEMNAKATEKISGLFIMTPRGELTQEELSRWYAVLGKNKELRSWAVDYLKVVISSEIDQLDGWIHVLEGLGGAYLQGLIKKLECLVAVHRRRPATGTRLPEQH